MNSLASRPRRWGGPRPFPPAYLDKLYLIPNPTRSLEDHRRLHHRDLDHLDDLAILRERRCVVRRLDYERDRSVEMWLTGRLAAIDRERGRRRGVS